MRHKGAITWSIAFARELELTVYPETQCDACKAADMIYMGPKIG